MLANANDELIDANGEKRKGIEVWDENLEWLSVNWCHGMFALYYRESLNDRWWTTVRDLMLSGF